jgi:hypothetical protein
MDKNGQALPERRMGREDPERSSPLFSARPLSIVQEKRLFIPPNVYLFPSGKTTENCYFVKL